MRVVALGVLAAAFTASAASAQPASGRVVAGQYICSVQQYARIASTHLENAPPPAASVENDRYRFRIVVTSQAGRLRIVEAPYTGRDRSNRQWEDENSTLHVAYVGDGRAFTAERGHGFLDFGPTRDQGLQFHHAGFQYAGGEDESLGVRWGRCVRE